MKLSHDSRIKPEHLERQAIVYPRQSSSDQVRFNVESTKLQLGLREKAISLGWRNPVVLDNDLGISAAGFAHRPGFQLMLTQVVQRAVGIIFCFDASRLSRNSKDWAALFELCGHFNTLIADQEQIYDLSIPNDRLVIGIKASVAELELSIIRTRLRSGLEAKAARGELKFIVPPGYTHDPDGRIILDPDRRVQEAIHALFDQFDRCSSVKQLALWYRDTQTLFPVRKLRKPCITSWQIPCYITLRHLLGHPIYAGTYTYGRSRQFVEYRDSKLVKRTNDHLPSDQWRVCIRDHHQAYISYDRFLANQSKIDESRPRWMMQDNRGAIRDGQALLAGLLRCGHCGNKIRVAYKRNPHSAMYYCDGNIQPEGKRRCLSFGSQLVDNRVSEELCRAVSPLGIEAARRALELCDQENKKATKQAELRVQAALYEKDLAFEQFDHVDPKNRLVADTLEERLNFKLYELQVAQEHLREASAIIKPFSDKKRKAISKLGRDFPGVWNHPKADPALKKKLLRAAIVEIIVKHQAQHQRLELVIHWQGGIHTQLHVKKRATPVGSKTDPSLVDMVRNLARLSDAEIARILNMKGIFSPRGLRWTRDRVLHFRRTHHICTLDNGHSNDHLTGQQVSQKLGISRNGVMGLIRIGALKNFQVTDFAPWMISRAEVDSEEVQALVRILKSTGRLPTPEKGGCLNGQLSLTHVNYTKEEKGAL